MSISFCYLNAAMSKPFLNNMEVNSSINKSTRTCMSQGMDYKLSIILQAHLFSCPCPSFIHGHDVLLLGMQAQKKSLLALCALVIWMDLI